MHIHIHIHNLDKPMGFEAGGSEPHGHTHQTIEHVLKDVGFTADEADAVYFGNWLRDYSQVVDPKITRAADMPKEFPTLLSRDAWTRLVDVLAVKKFLALRSRHADDMQVTAEKLGLYRASEHIDNPLVSDPSFPDPRVRDPDFEPWVLKGNPLLEVDPETSMKRYLSRSVDYMQQQLRLAMQQGRSFAGLRSLGAALHVLEDLFAHSNFVELSLIQAGHDRVLPWTTPGQSKHELPLVTGTFGGSDIIASLAAPLGKILFSTHDLAFELTAPGNRSERDQVMLILLEEHPDPNYHKAFTLFLEARDELISMASLAGIDLLRFYCWLLTTPLAILLNAFNSLAQGLITWIGNSVDDGQTLLGSDPNLDPAVEPSHSQLSKDHAEHPLQDLAANLASSAVRQVAHALVDHWNGKPDADPLAVAKSFFCHPADSDWQRQQVQAWASEHPAEVARAQSKTELDKVHLGAIEELRGVQKKLVDSSAAFTDYLFNSQDQTPSVARELAEAAFKILIAETSWWKALMALPKQ
ncbi:HET-C-related protein [Pseudomonas sp. NPDC090202]|uniref:HET-C-related protein n=1 Tax=unclassified Pseudomonas TaxID=196821 RepID=UPI003805E31C